MTTIQERLRVAFAASLMNANAGMRWLDHDSMSEMIDAAWVGFEDATADIPARLDEAERVVEGLLAERPTERARAFLTKLRKEKGDG